MISIRSICIFTAFSGLIACSNVRESGDIDGIYCQKYEIENVDNLDMAFMRINGLAKMINQHVEGCSDYEFDTVHHTITFSMPVLVHNRTVGMETRISVNKGGVTIWFAFNRFIGGESNKEFLTKDEMEALFDKEENLFNRIKSVIHGGA